MLNDDAKFLFCFSGFLGFIIFFLISSWLSQDTIRALVFGTCGCMLFSICGRALLEFMLKGTLLSNAKLSSPEKASLPPNNDKTPAPTQTVKKSVNQLNKKDS